MEVLSTKPSNKTVDCRLRRLIAGRYMRNTWGLKQPWCFEGGYSFKKLWGFNMIWPSNLGKFHGTYGECMVSTCTAEINSVTKIMEIEQLDICQKPFDTNIALIDGCSSFQIWYDRFWAIPKYEETRWEWWSTSNLGDTQGISVGDDALLPSWPASSEMV